MSNSVRPHGLQPTRLPRPWDSPGKNTGVGCHVLLQCMKVESESEVAQSCLTLSDPMDCSLPGSSIHGIFRATVLEWGAIAFSQGKWLGRSNVRASLVARRVKCLPAMRPGFDPWVRKIPRRRKWQPTRYSCLGNPKDREAWYSAVQGVTKSLTRLSNFTFTFQD